jgi:hypothetical protein
MSPRQLWISEPAVGSSTIFAASRRGGSARLRSHFFDLTDVLRHHWVHQHTMFQLTERVRRSVLFLVHGNFHPALKREEVLVGPKLPSHPVRPGSVAFQLYIRLWHHSGQDR